MTGSAGADTFIFNRNDGQDVIRGFEDDIDSIQLGSSNFTLSVSGGNAVLTFDAFTSLTVEGSFANLAQAQSVLGDDIV